MNASNTLRISPSTQVALAGFVELLGQDIDAFDAEDPNQLDLFAEEQANIAFMDERAELKAVIEQLSENLADARETLSDELASSSVYEAGLHGEITRLREEAAQSNAVLLHIAEYATLLQQRMNTIGITYGPGEDGTPHIEVDAERLIAVLTGQA